MSTDPTEPVHTSHRVLGSGELVERLRAAGILSSGAAVTVEGLDGGVSNDVLSISSGGRAIVVKQALERLRVDAEWYASPERIATEAEALRLAGRIRPDRVPGVIHFDPDSRILVVDRAGPTQHEWRQALLQGVVHADVAGQLGEVLGAWHVRTACDDEVATAFDSVEAFTQLRIEPFYRFVAARHPRIAPRIEDLLERMLTTRECLVHGDFSPKNVLAGPDALWVIDWEVAHLGDPVFDLAMMVGHLTCKSLNRPADTVGYRSAARAFLDAYHRAGGPAYDDEYLTAQVACLVLARVDGKSPATYLDAVARHAARELAFSVLRSRTATFDDLWMR